MPAKLRHNAIIVFGLALLFCWIFDFAKHDPMLRGIIPFGNDPYDAIGSFGCVTSVLLALASLARAFFPTLVGRSGTAIYVLRSQAAVAFCVLVTVAGDVAAMSRHASMWMGAVGQEELLILLGALIVSSFAVLAFVRNAQSPRTHGQYGQAVWVWLGSLLVLWIYPERVIAGTAGHLLTVVLGTLFLYLPAAMLVSAWLPSSTPDTRNRRIGRQRRHLRYLHSAVAAAIGLVVGVVAFLGEMSEGGPAPPFAQLLFVGGVYLGLGMIGLLIGYASLGRLLGFVVDGPISDC